MKPLFSFTFLVLFTCIISCKKNSDQSNNQTGQPGGKAAAIVLPAGSNINPNTLSVLAPYKAVAVNDGKFDSGDSSVNYTPVFVTDPNGKLILAGYTDDQSTNQDITVTSTALMLLMNTDLVRAISDSGKKALITQFKKNKDFPALEAEVNKLVLAGKDLLDTTNLELLNRLDAIFESESLDRLSQKHIPVGFTRDDRVLHFYSDDNIFHTSVGIYKDGKQLKQIAVDGHQVYPRSLKEAKLGIGMVYTGRSTESESYTMQEDGKFDIKMRTGLGDNDGSAEYTSADRMNGMSLTAYLLGIFVPITDRKYLTCAENSQLFTMETLKLAKNGDKAGLMKKINSSEFAESIKKCTGQGASVLQPYYAIEYRYDNLLDKLKLIKITGSLANVCFYLVQWNRANPFFDTCFVARGNNILKCSLQYDGLSDAGSDIIRIDLDKANGLPANPSGIISSLYLSYVYLQFNNDNATASFDAGMNFINTPGYSSRKFGSNVPRKIDFNGESLHIEFDNGSYTGNVVGNTVVGTFTLNWLHPDFRTKLPNGYPAIIVTMPLTLRLHPDK